jgi:pullulanase/glycogen debranching enzyme
MRRRYSDTIIYELHVKGFTERHPGVPDGLRGSYAGLAHEAAIAHLVDLGVTAVELLPVHQSVPESFLVARASRTTGATTRSGTSRRTTPTRRRCAAGGASRAGGSPSSRPW